jgi:hypothetical protein
LAIGAVVYAATRGEPAPTARPDAAAVRDTTREAGRKRSRADAAPSAAPSAPARTCPTPSTVEDAALKPSPDFVRTRFTNKACAENAAGAINACLDPDTATCERRMSNLKRLVREPGRCVERPAEVFCSTHANASESVLSFCFQTADKCEEYRRGRAGQPGVCRVAAACERVTLPPPPP